MNSNAIRNSLAGAVVSLALLAVSGNALATSSMGKTTDAYCKTYNNTTPINGNCSVCHASNRSTRKDPQWTWYLTAPAGASDQMKNFCGAAANQAPNGSISAPANNSTVTVGTTVSFAGSGSDPDNNTPLTYSWNFGGGATNSTAQNPSVNFTKAGTYTVTLTVSDAKGLADASPATITLKVVDAANQAPNGSISAPANNATVTVGTAVSFAGSGTDPDNNTPLTYSWNFGGAAANSTAQNPTVSLTKAGTYTVTLTVSDAKGLADSTPATITLKVVDAANQAPDSTITAPANNSTVTVGTAVSFAGSGSDPDNNTPLTYSWNFGGGATNSTVQNPSVSFAKAGTYTVTLTVSDAKGLADATPATRTITVTDGANKAPDSTITTPANNSTVTVGTTVSFAGSGSDPDNNTPLTYSWNFGGGATNSTAQNPKVAFSKAGTYTVSLTVTDAKGLADSSPAIITLKVTDTANQAPKGSITEPSGNVEIASGAQVKFAGAGSDPDNNTPLTYSWNFGGGATNSTAQNPTVSFAKPGTYTVTFTVTDAKGLADPMPPARTVVVRGGGSLPNGCSDGDGDGYSPDGGVCGPIDCSDNNAAINPGVREVCGDSIDNDCDGKADAADSECNGKDCISSMVKPPVPVIIKRSQWYSSTQKLEVYGYQAPVGTAVNLLNGKTGALIDSGVTRGDGWWKFNLYNLAVVPCRIRVEIAGQASEHHVNSAPATCDSATVPVNKAPESTIAAPADGASAVRGEAVSFIGSGSDPDGNTPLTYAWDFGGGSTSSQQNPKVVFNTAGVVTVKLVVKDAKGLADPTPASITIKVAAATGSCNPVAATLPLVINGAGEFCRVITGDISEFNSWNTQLVEINGVAFTNTYGNAWSSKKLPAKINGGYTIHYIGKYPWSHFEMKGKLDRKSSDGRKDDDRKDDDREEDD